MMDDLYHAAGIGTAFPAVCSYTALTQRQTHIVILGHGRRLAWDMLSIACCSADGKAAEWHFNSLQAG